MPNLGGLGGILPLRLGGGPSTALVLYKSLNSALGTAYDTGDGSTVTAETQADARTIEAIWSANNRLMNQWDPNRMTEFVPRWEKIFGLAPRSTDSMSTRRSRIAAKFLALGGPIYQTTTAACSALLGPIFVAVEYTPLANAHMNWPGGTPSLPNDFSSTIAHILVRVAQPTNMTQGEFLNTLNDMLNFLYDFLPAWASVDWGLNADNGMRGFYLDENNLDYQTFD